MSRVVIVSSDASELSRMSERLVEEHALLPAENALLALNLVFRERPDAVVFDTTLVGMDALEFIRILRVATDLAIIVLADGTGLVSATRALDAGADDFLASPLDYPEFEARLRGAVRRRSRQMEETAAEVVRSGWLVIDRRAQEVYLAGNRVRLSRTESALLDALAANVGRLVPHRQLLSSVWGPEYIGDTHYLRLYVGYLRQKLESTPSAPRYILNEWGIGYRLAELPVESEPLERRTEGASQLRSARQLAGALS